MTERRCMSRGLKIYLYKRLFLRANAGYRDPHYEMDNIDWDSVIYDGVSFQDNIESLKRAYPQYSWEVLEKAEEQHFARQKWEEDLSSESDARVYTTEIEITSHVSKTKGKAYRYGRIQLTVPKNWIGQTAKICVSIPLTEDEKSIARIASHSHAR